MRSDDTSTNPNPAPPTTTQLEGGPDEQHKAVGFDRNGDGKASELPWAEGTLPPGFDTPGDGAGEPSTKRSVFKPVGFDQGGDGKAPDDRG